MDNIFIFGHKNPDTDTVTSSIVLSYLKNKLGYNTEPRVLGDINSETKYALNYFKVEIPEYLNNVKLQIKDLKYQTNLNFHNKDSVYRAFTFMNSNKSSMVPVVDDNEKFVGIVSMKDIARNGLEDIYNEINTSYDNIIDTLNGKEILKFDDEIKGNTIVASYQHETFASDVHIDNNTILIVGNRNFIIEHAINNKVKLIIITGNHDLKDEHLELAKKNKVNIIKTPYDSFKTAKYFNFANYVDTVTLKDDVITFTDEDFVTEFSAVASKTKYSNYPILDKDNHCLGLLKMANISEQKKKKVILVDHNEFKQSADGIEESEIIEVIDHHNIGSIGTPAPINFRTMPVGCTNTILYTMYKENNIEIPAYIAGLMTSGIVSDTLLLKSPTTTELDKEVLEEVSKIAGVNWQEYGLDMLKAGSSLKGKTKEEILYQDFKNFPVGNEKMGIGQISTFNFDEIKEDIDSYVDLINKTAKTNDYKLLALFITDIIKNGSYVIFNDSAKEIVETAYKVNNIEQGHYIDGCVSRKKQMVPCLMEAIERK